MEFLPFTSIQPPSNHYGGQREQMLNLNQRLETYLNRVKLLDEENAKLTKEIQTLRRNHRGNHEQQKFLDEELRCARREVDTMWKERVYAEVDVARLTEELQTLDLQLQRETQAHIEANAKVNQSRRELEEEHRAQIWLTEKVNQLEHEMKSLIQTHQEEVANMEAMLMQTKVMPTMRPAVQQGPTLLELGEEYNQRAARAWQEAAEAYQGQLTRLEGSVNETRQSLIQVNKEKSESVLKLQNLDRELLGLQDLREHLEGTVNQQKESHCRDIQMLQEHLEALERERHTLAQKMDQLLQENRGLVQMKMSLSLEVATYRALLDNESLKRDTSLQKQPRNIYSKDVVFSPWGDNYQLSPSPKTTSSPSPRSMTGKTKPPVITTTPIRYQQYVPRREKMEISKEKVENNEVFQQPYPKVLKDGAIENFRPQEVNEKVTYAEPLSPPDEQEKTLGLERKEDHCNDTIDQPFEEKLESSLKYEARVDEANLLVEPALTEELYSFSMKSEPIEKKIENEEFEKPQAPIDAWIEEEMVSKREQLCVESSLDHHLESSSNLEEPISKASPELVKETFTEQLRSVTMKSQQEIPFVKEEVEKPQEPIDAWVAKEFNEVMKAVQEQVESSDSETQAFVEPNFDTKSSSPASECEPEEFLQNQLGEIVQEDFTFDSVGASMDGISPPKDKLYPDGEEMDTWDSVMERNQGLKADDLEQPQEVLKQHAEPEEDISAREVQQQMQEVISVEEMQAKFKPQIGTEGQEDSIKEDLPDKSEDEEQEDSQNVSVSWQTELEGDSYAQDNTLADTRPLIRYKSDETDANTQASHADDVDDSSDGEQDKKVGEMGSGAWIEDQTRRFGTMEDLCEEAEGEVLDEEYDLEYLRQDGKEDKDEIDTQKDEDKTQEEALKMVVDEKLDTDKWVEQELENLTTEYYATHFEHQHASAKFTLQDEIVADQPIAWGKALEGMPETTDQEEALVDQNIDEHFKEPQQQKDKVVKEVQELVEVEEEVKHDVSMVTHCDTTEDISEVRKEFVLSSTSQELSFEQKEPEKLGEQAEEKQSIVQDMVTEHVDQFITENENESKKLLPTSTVQEVTSDNVAEPQQQKNNAIKEVQELLVAEEEVKHDVSKVTHCDTTEDISEVRKEFVLSSTSQELSFDNLSFEQKEPENLGEQAEETQSILQDTLTEYVDQFITENENESKKLLPTSTVQEVTSDNVPEPQQQKDDAVKEVQELLEVEEEVKHDVSKVTHCDTTEDISEVRKEFVLSSTSQELSFDNFSFEQKEPEELGEQAEEKQSIVQDTLSEHVDEFINENENESNKLLLSSTVLEVTPNNVVERQQQKDDAIKEVQESVEVEEEVKHDVSKVTHCDTTEDISEVRKEIVLSSTSQELSFDNLSFEQKEPEELGEQAEETQSILQDTLTEHVNQFITINENESNKLLLSSTVLEVTPDNVVERQQQKDDAIKEVQESVEVEEEDKHDVSMVTHCDTTEDISEVRKEIVLSSTSQELSFDNLSFEQKEPEELGEQAEETQSILQDTLTEHVNQFITINENESNKLLLSSTVLEVTPDNVVEQQQQKDDAVKEVQEFVEVEEEDKHDVSMVTHCDTTEDISEVRKEFVLSSTSQELSFDNLSFEQKESENLGEQAEEKQSIVQDTLTEHMDQFINENDFNKLLLSSAIQEVTPDNVEMRDITPEESFVPEEIDTEFSKALATTEWEVLENPTENVHQDDKVEHDSLSPTDEPLNISPESVHEATNLFIVKDSKELLKTNGKTSLDDMFSINANNDFWVSPLETGATYQPDNVDNKHAEWKLGFGDADGRETEELVEKSDIVYEQKEVSQIFTKSVVKGEIVHSEESEDDSEAMSSDEE
ncbi:nestin [Periophthalmus magnuspinnatus]|uniref:nestin n=1 Tax=Periophthalmus magnuspinnatus TaxID=409849 RepID=UPI00145BCD9C|nr:nestin [Periophthalmus magnuspinnatus]